VLKMIPFFNIMIFFCISIRNMKAIKSIQLALGNGIGRGAAFSKNFRTVLAKVIGILLPILAGSLWGSGGA